MITMRPAGDRGGGDFGWLNTRHTFSFGEYHDPAHMGFRSLRVINEDRVAPGRGFGSHPHRDMEIVTYVLSGSLKHKDSLGHEAVLKPGEVQRITAGRGVTHSEFNPSPTEGVHFLQIWLAPSERGAKPSYEQKNFSGARADRLAALVTPDGADGSVMVGQDARVYAAVLGAGKSVSHPIDAGRALWVQAVRGGLTLNRRVMSAGDGASVEDEPAAEIVAGDAGAEVLVFDLA